MLMPLVSNLLDLLLMNMEVLPRPSILALFIMGRLKLCQAIWLITRPGNINLKRSLELK